MATRTCAVIIAAYRAERWIEECLASWAAVRVPEGWTVDMRIGVDGCEETKAELDRLGQTYRCAKKNVGPYVIRNSLVLAARADAYAIFDADDRALPNYLTALLPLVRKGVSAGAHYSIDERGERARNRARPHSNGICLISHTAWRRIGGYRPWRMAADHEMHGRLKRLGVRKRTTEEAVYERRVHSGSLTRSPATGFKSAARRDAKRKAKRLWRKPPYKIGRPRTVELSG